MAGNNKLIVGLLAVSVAANLLAAGVWIGRELAPGGRERFSGPPRVDFSLREFGQYLPDDKKDEVRALLKAHRKALVANFREMRDTEREIRGLMTAEVVDREALVKALDRKEAAMDKLHMPVRQILLDVVAGLDHETRVKLAENMFRRRMMLVGRDGGPGGPGRGDGNERHFHRHVPPPDDEFGPEEGPEDGPEGGPEESPEGEPGGRF